LDLIREVLDKRRTSYTMYLPGWVQTEDAQKVVQMRRTSEAGLQTGYAMFVDGKMERLPEELAQDCIFPEGVPDSFSIMNALLQGIPRDADYDSQLWTTVDMDRNNMRKKMISKMVQGFGLYLVLTGKNFIYEAKTEARYRDLLIVCNVQASSGPLDMEGLLYSINGVGSRLGVTDSSDSSNQVGQQGGRGRDAQAPAGGSAKRKRSMEEAEDGMEGGIVRRGVVRCNANPKCRNKVCAMMYGSSV
jgi:hypothetical protein